MIEVDISKLTDVIAVYENYIKQMDDNNFQLISEYNAIRKYWHDQKCINMYSSFDLEKNRIIRNADNLKYQLKLYKYIRSEYSKLGNKISCNLRKKDDVLDKVNIIIRCLNSIINKYDNLGDISFFSGAYMIRAERGSLVKLLNSFENIRDGLTEKYYEISEIENQILEMNSSIKLENFSLNNYESEV